MEKIKFFNLSMFCLRLIVGLVFVIHGSQKLFGTFEGIGLEGTAKLIEGLGLAEPYIIAAVWGAIEFIGGMFLILGVLARWAAAMIVLTVFIYLFKMDLVYSSLLQYSAVEYNMIVIGACVPIILMGGGSWSVWDV